MSDDSVYDAVERYRNSGEFANSSPEECIDDLLIIAADYDRLKVELDSIDAVLARRPALDLPTRRENIEKAVVFGWPWFGVGMVRFHVTESSWYTMWMLFLTTKFAVGFHIGGVSKGM